MSILTTQEISKMLKVSDRTVRNWIESGELKAYRFGNQYRVEVSDFETFKNKSLINQKEIEKKWMQ